MNRLTASDVEASFSPFAGVAPADATARPASRSMAGLLTALVALPIVLMALGAWTAWRDAWRDAEAAVTQAAEAVSEFGLRVLGEHAVAAGRVEALLRGLSDEQIRAREPALHAELRAVVAEMPQAEAAYVIDRDGAVLLSANLFPVPRDARTAADRDFFLDLRADDAPAVHVSRVHTGRLDGSLFFAVSRRRASTGNSDLPPDAFDGLVNVSVYPNRLAEGLRRIAPRPGDTTALVRTDGELLARSTGQDGPLRLRTDGPFARATAGGVERARYAGASVVDGVQRLYAVQRIEGWPVYAQATRPRAAVIAEWRQTVAGQLMIGVPTTLALLALASLVRRGKERLAQANADLDRQVAERTAALQDSQARLRLALDGAHLGVWDIDLRSGLLTHGGHSPPTAPGLSSGCYPVEAYLRHAVHPEDVALCRSVLAAAASGREPSYRIELRVRVPHPPGYVWWESYGSVVAWDPETGAPTRIAGIGHDITTRKAAEDAARHAEVRLQEATAGAGIGTYEIDFTSNATWFDARAVQILGGDLPIGTWLDLDGPEWTALEARLHPEDRAAFVDAWASVASGAAEGWALEARLRGPDDSWIWTWCHGTVVERDHATGRPQRLVGIELDVTERHRLEEELRQAQKMEALGQLAGGIAHDINNVLQAVAGAATMIGRDAARDPEGVRRRARALSETVGRGAAITGRLLAFARRGDLKVAPIAPASLLAALRELLTPLLGAPITVRVEAPPGLPSLMADPDQLQTALVNLATNARDAMPDGGVLTLSAVAEVVADGSPRAPHVPAALGVGRYVRLSVTDTGCGMDTATLARVGNPFFTTKAVGKGTGLGLSMAKGLAEQSGGGVAIESEPGRGTTVSLWFPQVAEEVASPPTAGPTEVTTRHELRVLVVDDDEAVREAVADQLSAAGLTVQAARDGEEALTLLDGSAPVDALVTDLTMPGMDGMALIREARRRRPGLPAVLLTGHAEDTDVLAERGQAGGRFALVHKPAHGPEIATRIATLLEA